jgi:pyruvate kinase
MNQEAFFQNLTQRNDDTRAATKIVCTIGPASEDKIVALIDAGMSVARINFSHGDGADHRRRVERVRAAAAERRAPVGILADLQGPKLRLGRLEDGPRRLEANEDVTLTEGESGASGVIPLNIEGFLAAAQPGHRVLLCDAADELVVQSVHSSTVTARVRRGGEVSDRKGVHLPD